jgi:hypothetical protein
VGQNRSDGRASRANRAKWRAAAELPTFTILIKN